MSSKRGFVDTLVSAGQYAHNVGIKRHLTRTYFNVIEIERTDEEITYIRLAYDTSKLKLYVSETRKMRKSLVKIPATPFNCAVFDIVAMINNDESETSVLNACLEASYLQKDNNTLVISVDFCRALKCKEILSTVKYDATYNNIFRLYYIRGCLQCFKDTQYFKGDYDDAVNAIYEIATNGTIHSVLNTVHSRFNKGVTGTIPRSLHNVLLMHKVQRPPGKYEYVGTTYKYTAIEQTTSDIKCDMSLFFKNYAFLEQKMFHPLPRVDENYIRNSKQNTGNQKKRTNTSTRGVFT